MNLLEIVDQRDQKLKSLESFNEKVKLEKRMLNEDESLEFNKVKTEVENLNKKINEVKEADKRATNNVDIKNNEKKMNTFNLIEKLKDTRNGETINLVEERSVIVAGVDNQGQDFISEDKGGIIEPLRNKLVLVQAGATFLTGLKGDLSLAGYNGSTASWKGENVTAVDGAGATFEVTLSPKRLTCFIDVSKQFLVQDTLNAESMLMNDIVKAVADKFESTIFSGAAGSATQPAGLFATTLTNYGAASWSNVVGLETAITASNIDYTKASYITSAKGRGKLKSAAKSTNAGIFVLEGNEMNGYPVLTTNAVIDTISGLTSNYSGGTESGIVFADWSQFVIGQWGTIDLTVDTVTQAHLGNIRLVVNAYFDAAKRVSGAFAVGSIL
jgi:HK97 family phage major capsid protein